ncbi:hypothetical protein EBO15_08820 [Actinomadura harenae]|uniref:Uncharacterized protein n=1 Tax=Actinomadura harenae TaxID=2483351 RepID=A0A3M2M863_9ACTN|nr:hypothetical protein EBO15_08820 [Actinomadura harenae]
MGIRSGLPSRRRGAGAAGQGEEAAPGGRAVRGRGRRLAEAVQQGGVGLDVVRGAAEVVAQGGAEVIVHACGPPGRARAAPPWRARCGS